MALRIYDISIDAYRDVTQLDLDEYQAVANAYGLIQQAIQTHHAQLRVEIAKIRSRAGAPNDFAVVNDEPTGDL